LTVLVTGFGALLTFRAVGPRTAGLPGPFDFASVTWGDSLCLPLMTGFFAYVVRTLPPARGDARFAVGAALLGGALGVASQIAWLSNDAPRRNWTLPRPHHFTAAGWYHAVFVAVLCTITAALLALALNRVTLNTSPPRRAWPAIGAGAAAGLVFIALLAADTGARVTPDSAGTGLLGTLIGLAAAAVAAVALAARRRGRRP
jgi:hypothetical protein